MLGPELLDALPDHVVDLNLLTRCAHLAADEMPRCSKEVAHILLDGDAFLPHPIAGDVERLHRLLGLVEVFPFVEAEPLGRVLSSTPTQQRELEVLLRPLVDATEFDVGILLDITHLFDFSLFHFSLLNLRFI